MGNIPVIARLVWPDAEEWRPATANRWTKTHVLVTWAEDGQPRERLVWLRAEDVTRVIRRPRNTDDVSDDLQRRD